MQDSMGWLKVYQDSMDLEISGLYVSGHATALEGAVSDALSAGGKRVRGTLALLWCEAFSGDFRLAIPLAVAYELAHASALIQDDIIDHSDLRRGRKSIVAKYGLSNAILASDLLLFYVPKMVAKYSNLESRRLGRVFDLVGEACRATTWGEFLDLEMARHDGWSEREYEEMIRLKTSTLLSAPCASGAIVGGADDEQVSVATRFGEAVGMAYQIQDDALDLIGDESLLGKPVLTDMRGGKKSAVLMHCADRCSDEDRRFIFGLMNRAALYKTDEITRLRGLIEDTGSLSYAREKIARYSDEAKGALEAIPASRARSLLEGLVGYLASRYS